MVMGMAMIIHNTRLTPTIHTQNKISHGAANIQLLPVQLLAHLQDMTMNMITTAIMGMMQNTIMITPR